MYNEQGTFPDYTTEAITLTLLIEGISKGNVTVTVTIGH